MHKFTTNLSKELPCIHVEAAKGMEGKTPRNNETSTLPNFVDITKEQSFWDKAVLS